MTSVRGSPSLIGWNAPGRFWVLLGRFSCHSPSPLASVAKCTASFHFHFSSIQITDYLLNPMNAEQDAWHLLWCEQQLPVPPQSHPNCTFIRRQCTSLTGVYFHKGDEGRKHGLIPGTIPRDRFTLLSLLKYVHWVSAGEFYNPKALAAYIGILSWIILRRVNIQSYGENQSDAYGEEQNVASVLAVFWSLLERTDERVGRSAGLYTQWTLTIEQCALHPCLAGCNDGHFAAPI